MKILLINELSTVPWTWSLHTSIMSIILILKLCVLTLPLDIIIFYTVPPTKSSSSFAFNINMFVGLISSSFPVFVVYNTFINIFFSMYEQASLNQNNANMGDNHNNNWINVILNALLIIVNYYFISWFIKIIVK